MCEIHVSGCQFCIHECVKAQRIPVEVKPVVIWGFWKTYPWSSKLMDGWRNVCPKTSQVMAIRKITTPRMVARGAGECDDRICFALRDRASIAFHLKEGPIQSDTETCRTPKAPRKSSGNSLQFAFIRAGHAVAEPTRVASRARLGLPLRRPCVLCAAMRESFRSLAQVSRSPCSSSTARFLTEDNEDNKDCVLRLRS